MKNFFSRQWLILALSALMCIPLFYQLGKAPIRMWDESRLAINAYEMHYGGDYLVTHYGGSPDMWNTKPPLMIWLQSLSMKLFGVNEFAVRFPSALAGLITFIILMTFAASFFGNRVLFIIASLILVTSPGYVGHHVTRTGDYDTLLVLFTTLFNLCFFIYLENKKNKYLYLTFIFITLAVLTKSIVGLIFLPALFLYSLLTGHLIPLLKNRHLYLGALVFILIVAGYYLLRESQNPGYLQAVYDNELGGRYMEVTENHQHGPLFYYYEFFVQFPGWFFLVPAGLLIGLFHSDRRLRRLSLFLLIACGVFFGVISTAGTKLIWYDAPLMPFVALFAAIPLYLLYEYTPQVIRMPDILGRAKKFIPALVIVLIFAFPFKKILSSFENTGEQLENAEFYELSHFLKDALENQDPSINNATLIYDAQTLAHIQFYMNKLYEKGIRLSLTTYPEALEPGDVVIVSQDFYHEFIGEYYTHELLAEKGKVKMYRITTPPGEVLPAEPPLKESFENIRIYETGR